MVKAKVNGKYPIVVSAERAQHLKNWEPERISYLFDNIRKGDVVWDIGAELGDISALMALAGAKVYLVEPSPHYWEKMRILWNANSIKPRGCFVGFASNVDELEPENLDIPSRGFYSGWPEISYLKYKNDLGFRHLSQEADATPQTKLDSLEWEPPQLINIDVEGSELEVLRGAEKTLTKHKPLVFVSIHPAFMQQAFGYLPAELHEYMKDLGYFAKPLAIDHEQHWLFQHKDYYEAR